MTEYAWEVDARPERGRVSIRRGDAVVLDGVVEEVDDDTGVVTLPDITDASIVAKVRRDADDTVVATWTTTITDGEAAEYRLSLDDSVTDDLGGWYVCDVQYTPSGGDAQTIGLFDFEVEADVTR